MTLTLTAEHLQAMRSHAERDYPNECCGLLLGTSDSANGAELVIVQAVNNGWSVTVAQELDEDPTIPKTRRYWIDPADLFTAMREARKIGLDIIGICHSHTDHPAIPSECDRRLAWHPYFYIILSVYQGIAQDLRSWQLAADHQFYEQAIVLQPSVSIPTL